MKWWTIINKNKEAKEARLSLGGGSRVLCRHEADEMSNFGTSRIMVANSNADVVQMVGLLDGFPTT